MGGEGFAIAVVVVLLLCYLLPALVRRQAVITETVVEERFSENLRVLKLKKHVAHQRTESHGFIYHTERKVKPAQRKTKTIDELGGELRKLARSRAHTKRRMNTRNTFLQRFQFATVALTAIAAVIWLAVGLTSLSLWVGVGATLLSLSGMALTFSLRKNVALENTKDRQRLQNIEAKIEQIKHGVTPSQVRQMQEALKARVATRSKESATLAVKPEAGTEDLKSGASAQDAKFDFNGETETVDIAATSTVAPKRPEATANFAKTSAKAHVTNSDSSSVGLNATSGSTAAKKLAAPSYTLRGSVTRRAVKPYVAPEQETTAVPYRPRNIGERLGDAPLEAALPAPEMTGTEELRKDVLGGGATLDFLLERRRA